MKFCTAAEMRRLDQKTIEECGLPGVVLMENAGRGAAGLVEKHFGSPAGKKIVVLAGKGNNGGDGFVMARIFHGQKARVTAYLLGEREKVQGDARINLEVMLKMGLELIEIREETHLERLDLSGADLIVDALLGTGLTSEVRGLYRDVIEAVNRSGRPVVAVDAPSGVCSDTGRIMGAAVRADLTTTFGLPKIGLLIGPGETLAGRLEVVDIGLPPHVIEEADPQKELLTAESLKGLLRPRDPNGHKGTYGHVLIAAGSTGKTGAAAMAALAALRAGSGLVTLAVPAGLNPVLEQQVLEVMTEPLPESLPGFLGAEAASRILELVRGKSVLALGPGLGLRPEVGETVRTLVREAEAPLVIDADGLNHLADAPQTLKKARREVVLTPHPGEMARLSGKDTATIASDRLSAAADFAKTYGTILVLKGRRSVIASPDGRVFLNTTGGPYMASGGMGDILTGLIAGLIAQGLSPLDAARLGVFVHGLAADRIAEQGVAFGLAASDLLPVLPKIWSELI